MTDGASPLSAAELEHFRRDRIDWGMTAGPNGTPLMDIHKVLDRLLATIAAKDDAVAALQAQVDALKEALRKDLCYRHTTGRVAMDRACEKPGPYAFRHRCAEARAALRNSGGTAEVDPMRAAIGAALVFSRNWPTVEQEMAALQAQVAELTRALDDLLLPGHKCEPVARMHMGEGRDWWLGKLTEPLPDWPEESHCFHVTTPLKSFVLGMNRADWDQLAVVSYIVGGDKHLNADWVERMAAGMRKRAAALADGSKED